MISVTVTVQTAEPVTVEAHGNVANVPNWVSDSGIKLYALRSKHVSSVKDDDRPPRESACTAPLRVARSYVGQHVILATSPGTKLVSPAELNPSGHFVPSIEPVG